MTIFGISWADWDKPEMEANEWELVESVQPVSIFPHVHAFLCLLSIAWSCHWLLWQYSCDVNDQIKFWDDYSFIFHCTCIMNLISFLIGDKCQTNSSAAQIERQRGNLLNISWKNHRAHQAFNYPQMLIFACVHNF